MGYGVMVELFQKGETSAVLSERNINLKQEIKNLSDNDILYRDFEEWVNYFFEKYKIQPITLFMEKVTRSLSETKVKQLNPLRDFYGESEVCLVDGYKITFNIPFDGDSNFLFLKPSTFYLKRFFVDNIKESSDSTYGEITFSLNYIKQEIQGKDKDNILSDFNREFKNYMIRYHKLRKFRKASRRKGHGRSRLVE
jgi:hypothetical protein